MLKSVVPYSYSAFIQSRPRPSACISRIIFRVGHEERFSAADTFSTRAWGEELRILSAVALGLGPVHAASEKLTRQPDWSVLSRYPPTILLLAGEPVKYSLAERKRSIQSIFVGFKNK